MRQPSYPTLRTLVTMTIGVLSVTVWPSVVAAADDPGSIVEQFIAAFNERDLDRVEALLTEDAIYHNLPMQPVSGKDAVMQAIRSYAEPAEVIDWQISHQAVVGNVVLNERVDRFVLGGNEIVLPVMGAFEIRDGKIAAWRDYFDLATWQRQTGTP